MQLYPLNPHTPRDHKILLRDHSRLAILKSTLDLLAHDSVLFNRKNNVAILSYIFKYLYV